MADQLALVTETNPADRRQQEEEGALTMRIRIIIDTQDADDPDAIEIDMPFTLNVYKDDDDGTPSRQPLEIGNEGCLVGYNIGHMLGALGEYWRHGGVLGQDDRPLPIDGDEWRTRRDEEN